MVTHERTLAETKKIVQASQIIVGILLVPAAVAAATADGLVQPQLL